MKIIISAQGQNLDYSFNSINLDTLKLIKKSLYSNFMANNFKNDEEEDLCEKLLCQLEGIMPDERHSIAA